MQLPDIQTLEIGDVKPYPDNPRKTPKEAVQSVKESIQNYGYVQPILVDRERVIVSGHTRYAALQELGHDTVDVYVTDLPEEKVREFRLADNRLSELTEWDHSALVTELREWESDLLGDLFPTMDLEVGEVGDTLQDVTEEDVQEATEAVKKVEPKKQRESTKIECPSCSQSFDVDTEALP